MIELFTWRTPNGWKVSIALEELGLDYKVTPVDIGTGIQKQPWFLAINPNGRIPAIIDHDRGGFTVFESGAILLYLAEKTGRLIPSDPEGRSTVIQWLMFQMGGVGPMMGQANVFFRYAPDKIPFAIERYQRESRRLFEVLDSRLGKARYLGGDEYSIADIATYPWVKGYAWAGLNVDGLDHLQRWMGEVAARPAVIRGLLVPTPESVDTHESIAATGRKILV